MFRLKYNVKLTRFISATRASFIRATFEKTMIRIEAGVLAISMRKFPRGKEKEFYIEAIDKVKMKNSRLSEIAKKSMPECRFSKCKMFTDALYLWIDRTVWKFVLFRETNLSMMYLRSKDSNSIIWTLSLERIIKSSILVPILRTNHSQIHESPLFPFFQRIEQLFVRVKNTLERKRWII